MAERQPAKVGGSNTMLTAQDAAGYLGLSYKYLMRCYRGWRIPCHRYTPGGKVHFRERDLESFLARTREAA